MSRLLAVPASSLRRQAWANGAGTTTVIASGPDEANWAWRLSIADITQACVFSSWPDTRRQIVALDAPLHLHFDDNRDIALLRLCGMRFDGAETPRASLPEGPTRAFNLMLRNEAQGELIARPLNGGMSLPQRDGWRWLAHWLTGRAEIQLDCARMDMAPGSSVWIDAQPGERVRIEGGGELVLVQLAVADCAPA